jgi:hypothetical protein
MSPGNQISNLDDLDGITLKASDAFRAMGLFVAEFAGRVKPESALATLWADIEVQGDGLPGDPAALEDWLKCIEQVLVRGEPGSS